MESKACINQPLGYVSLGKSGPGHLSENQVAIVENIKLLLNGLSFCEAKEVVKEIDDKLNHIAFIDYSVKAS